MNQHFENGRQKALNELAPRLERVGNVAASMVIGSGGCFRASEVSRSEIRK